jgi:hypothetical protein
MNDIGWIRINASSSRNRFVSVLGARSRALACFAQRLTTILSPVTGGFSDNVPDRACCRRAYSVGCVQGSGRRIGSETSDIAADHFGRAERAADRQHGRRSDFATDVADSSDS